MEYKIDFKHGMIDGDDKRFTHCYILKKDSEEEGWYFLTEGRAYCNPKDNFSYEKGRRVSLTKALAPLWKEVRTKLWKQYFDEKLSARMTSKDHEFADDMKEFTKKCVTDFAEALKTNTPIKTTVTGCYLGKPGKATPVYNMDNKLIQIIIDLE